MPKKIILAKTQKKLLSRLIPLLLGGPKSAIELGDLLIDPTVKWDSKKLAFNMSLHDKLIRLYRKGLIHTTGNTFFSHYWAGGTDIGETLSQGWSLTPLADLIQDELGVVCE